MNFTRVLQTLAAYFEAGSQPFLVVGGLALQAYGFTRATQDVDLTLALSSQDSVIRFLESLGYQTLHRSDGFSNHLHSQAEWGRVDVIYVDDATMEKLLSKPCKPWPIAGRTFLVPRQEHLIAMKIHAMKNNPRRTFKELADIQCLMGLPDTDDAAVAHYFEQAGLLERYHELKKHY